MSQALSANSVLHAHDTVSEERRALEWFWEVARNFNQDLIRRIQAGVMTPGDIDGSPKVSGAIAAWNRYLEFTRGVIVEEGRVTHIPS